jgi:hypothetical protein
VTPVVVEQALIPSVAVAMIAARAAVGNHFQFVSNAFMTAVVYLFETKLTDFARKTISLGSEIGKTEKNDGERT